MTIICNCHHLSGGSGAVSQRPDGGPGMGSGGGQGGGGPSGGNPGGSRCLGPPDVYPQDPNQMEDELNQTHVKHGFSQTHAGHVREVGVLLNFASKSVREISYVKIVFY